MLSEAEKQREERDCGADTREGEATLQRCWWLHCHIRVPRLWRSQIPDHLGERGGRGYF